MTNEDIGAAEGAYVARCAHLTIPLGPHVFYRRLLPSSCSLPLNCCGTKPSASSLCLL
jgi:hypothetical protein